jgi:ribosomal protein L7/L12
MASDPDLSIQLDQIYLRLQAVENQLAILSQRMGVPFSQTPAGVMDPAPAGVYYDPDEGVSYDPAVEPTASPFVDTGPGGLPPDLVAMARSGKKIQAIKLYREMTGCDLRTAKRVIDSL